MDDNIIPIRPEEDLLVVGGEIEGISAALCFYGDDLQPDEITAILGVEPTRWAVKGERLGPRSPPLPHGYWFCSRRSHDGEASLDQLAREILMQICLPPADWAALRARYRVEFRVGFLLGSWNEGTDVSGATLAMLGALQIPMSFDVYAAVVEE